MKPSLRAQRSNPEAKNWIASIVDAWGQAGIVTRFAEVPGANHFTALAPLADPNHR